MRRAFRLQADEVATRWLTGVEEPAALLAGEAEGIVARPIVAFRTDQAVEVASIWGRVLGLDGLDADAPLIRTVNAIGADRIKGVTVVTQRHVQQSITRGLELGLTPNEIAYGNTNRARQVFRDEGWRPIFNVVETTYRGRAENIARTELALASQHSAHGRFRERDVVDVFIRDGPDCGWRTHDDADKANGTTRSLTSAEQYPVAHPRCRRVSVPILPSDPLE